MHVRRHPSCEKVLIKDRWDFTVTRIASLQAKHDGHGDGRGRGKGTGYHPFFMGFHMGAGVASGSAHCKLTQTHSRNSNGIGRGARVTPKGAQRAFKK